MDEQRVAAVAFLLVALMVALAVAYLTQAW